MESQLHLQVSGGRGSRETLAGWGSWVASLVGWGSWVASLAGWGSWVASLAGGRGSRLWLGVVGHVSGGLGVVGSESLAGWGSWVASLAGWVALVGPGSGHPPLRCVVAGFGLGSAEPSTLDAGSGLGSAEPSTLDAGFGLGSAEPSTLDAGSGLGFAEPSALDPVPGWAPRSHALDAGSGLGFAEPSFLDAGSLLLAGSRCFWPRGRSGRWARAGSGPFRGRVAGSEVGSATWVHREAGARFRAMELGSGASQELQPCEGTKNSVRGREMVRVEVQEVSATVESWSTQESLGSTQEPQTCK